MASLLLAKYMSEVKWRMRVNSKDIRSYKSMWEISITVITQKTSTVPINAYI